MNGLLRFVIALVLSVLCLNACSSAPAKKSEERPFSKAPEKVIKTQEENQKSEEYPQNLDLAHAAFLQAIDLELRGKHVLTDGFIAQAYEADPRSRYLAFEIAERLASRKEDSLALVQAEKANQLPGKKLARQYALLAHLYVKEGSADSAKKYFNLGLDSSRYQDMPLLYDYSLFLEIIKDIEELVRVYDLLLPQVNYIPSLFYKQVLYLTEMNRDSALVDLFIKGYNAQHERSMLEDIVKLLMKQKRYAEALSVADTITTSDETAEKIVVSMVTNIAERNQDSAFAFLKKKFYEDSVRTPILLNFLGHYEFLALDLDSAKVHLLDAIEQLKDKPVYVVNGYRALTSIALNESDKKSALYYALKADSVSFGAERPMLVMTYGYVGEYKKAYVMLDSLLAVWSAWKPPVGVDSVEAYRMRIQADRMHRQFRNSYARIYTFEAISIENNVNATDSMKAYAMEARERAELFWESLLLSDSTDMGTRFYMAMNLERMKRIDESFAMFEFLLKQPESSKLDFPEIKNYYGYSLIDENRSVAELERGYNLVLEALEKVTNPDSKNAYLDSKAWGLYRMGKFKEAYETIKLINVKKMEKDVVYWEHLASIQAALGLKMEATKSYKVLLRLNPKHAGAKAYISRKH